MFSWKELFNGKYRLSALTPQGENSWLPLSLCIVCDQRKLLKAFEAFQFMFCPPVQRTAVNFWCWQKIAKTKHVRKTENLGPDQPPNSAKVLPVRSYKLSVHPDEQSLCQGQQRGGSLIPCIVVKNFACFLFPFPVTHQSTTHLSRDAWGRWEAINHLQDLQFQEPLGAHPFWEGGVICNDFHSSCLPIVLGEGLTCGGGHCILNISNVRG